jgi:hypothetical protein
VRFGSRKILAAAVVVVCGYAFLEWNVSPATLESRMLDKASRFLGALQTGDRLTVLKLTVSEQEALEEEQVASSAVSGSVKVSPSSALDELPGRSIWDPTMLAELEKHARAPVSYTLNTDAYTPSIALNFDCAGKATKCLEHVKFFFTARAGKIESYVMFWNEPEWRELWQGPYSKGLPTKDCGDACPF